jgi:class 3 adenylate cyclase
VTTSAGALDFAFDLRAERRRRVRRFLRVAVPIVTLLILLAAIAGIGVYLSKANRADARVLTDDLLEELERRIVAEVVNFLQPASVMVRLTQEVLKDDALEDQRKRLAEPLTMYILESNPQLSTFNFADPRGNFLMLKKMPGGPIHTKFMDRRGDGVETTWVRRDGGGNVVATERDPDDSYDPRTRIWYQGAQATGKLFWSDVYIFFTDQRPGITASLPVYDESGDLAAVYAVDIALEHLSAFLGDLEIGQRGRAMIIDDDGVLVAYPVLEKMLKKTDGVLERAHIEELADPILNRAFDRFRIDGPGKRELIVEGRRHINTASSLKSALGRDWTLLIVAPEEDFVGFVAENDRQGLYMSVAVLGLASLLAGLLVFQGLRADRNAQLVFERQKQLEAQSRAFSGLASQAALFDSDDESAVATLTETVARTVSARRISIWHLGSDAERLVCVDAFDKETGGHTAGMELSANELPQFFQAMAEGGEIVVIDAATDPRTAELHRIYLHPLNCRALASVPIVQGVQTLGVMWLEYDAAWADHESQDVAFAKAVANMLALRMRSDDTGEIGRARNGGSRRAVGERSDIAEPMRETELVTGRRAEAFLARIASERGEGTSIEAQIFEDVTVVVMRFSDPVSLAVAVDGEGRNAVDDLAQKLETLAVDYGVEYLKLLGNQIVCASGFTEESRRGADVMADFALDAMDHCARLFTKLERPMELQVGIDSGPVIGSAVGRDHSVFNLWGDAVLTASRMAETGVAGHIQATESTYRRLHEDFLFRVRGSYYLQGFGEFTTYILMGRL